MVFNNTNVVVPNAWWLRRVRPVGLKGMGGHTCRRRRLSSLPLSFLG